MRCLVYRSTLRTDTYVYLAREEALDELPEALRERLGRLEFALEFDLTSERRLARCDARAVLAQIEDRGYYLQLPPGEWTGYSLNSSSKKHES
ncbi:MAG: YcgL domain-containing protein [Halofilum sp. (in: g-proteobacteria)]|nr:YcgL domain-containing protein [Halofilum sp. (in: g-proteobacteria)]